VFLNSISIYVNFNVLVNLYCFCILLRPVLQIWTENIPPLRSTELYYATILLLNLSQREMKHWSGS
jgi:hypothetical protein